MEELKDKPWHKLPAEEVIELLGVNLSTGLSGDEVRSRQKEFGPNRVTSRRGTPAWMKFLQQFNQPLVYILLLACGVTAFLGEWVDSAVIFGVVLINAVVGFLQEAKAEKAIEALARMIATEATVRRDGRQQRIHSDEIVPGEVVLLRSGDRVPADLRFVQVRNLHADESALTGESLPVAKHPDLLFNCRSLQHSIFSIGMFTNRWTIVGSLAMLGAQLLFTYAPVMNKLFHSAPLAADSWLRIVGVAAMAFVAVEFEKWIRFGRRRGEHAIPA